jgi:hypothetical protein
MDKKHKLTPGGTGIKKMRYGGGSFSFVLLFGIALAL